MQALYAIRHKAKQPYEPDARDFYKLFFLCKRAEASELRPGPETSEVGFFAPNELPELSRGRVVKADILNAFAFNSGAKVLFD